MQTTFKQEKVYTDRPSPLKLWEDKRLQYLEMYAVSKKKRLLKCNRIKIHLIKINDLYTDEDF